ncbi:hypothetical protein [uncultured Olleya sp.]|uniref:hypothetical protein n=1 Tax=uncultured Olleya sp. TaxID=757243 RepID=UPI002594C477|nr:hypothetical protein [uncultured Olleya sp.]
MEVEITNGEKIIQLLFDEFASCLVIETALTVNWPDCAGSVGEYYALSSFSSDKRNSLTSKLNEVLIDGEEEEVYNSIKEFLKLFSNGNYKVNIDTMKLDTCNFMHEGQVKYSENVAMSKRFSGAFYQYPYDKSNIFFTTPNNAINNERVDYYKQRIQNGLRPKAITYELYSPINANFTACYLLDGHHKTKAYLELGIDIPTVNIVKTERAEGQTQEILNASAPILKDFEFEHFLINNDENLESVDFINDSFLTSKLDEILIKNSRLGIGILKLFLKIDKSKDEKNLIWLIERLKILSINQTIGNGLILKYYGFNESLNYDCWTYDEIESINDYNNWVNKTLPNNGYNA